MGDSGKMVKSADLPFSSIWKTMRKFFCLLYVFLILYTCALFAEDFSGKCVGIGDGDTISVMRYGRAVKVRLEGIDCPELGQAFGTRAKRFTSAMVFRKIVDVREYDKDEYDRIVARVYVEGKDLSLELVRAGLAWRFRRSSDLVLDKAEAQARTQKRGLWSTPNPIPPWEYRRKHGRRS